jgi:hypothetical protein
MKLPIVSRTVSQVGARNQPAGTICHQFLRDTSRLLLC